MNCGYSPVVQAIHADSYTTTQFLHVVHLGFSSDEVGAGNCALLLRSLA